MSDSDTDLNRDTDVSLDRRRALTVAAGAALPLTGCLHDDDTGGDEGDGGPDSVEASASFFLLYDLARNVADEDDDVVDLVPVGSHGDDWQPRPRIVEDIIDGNAFVSIEGFRGWSDRQMNTLRSEYPHVEVIDAAEDIEFIEGEGGRERDPHFWLDPSLAADAVDNIADSFTEVRPDNSEVYAENAESYRERLMEVDQRFRDELADRERDLVVMGNHNSFAYWEPAYGIEVVSATGLSPDEDVTARDRERIEDLIREHGIEYIAYDMYEDDRVTDQIADSAGVDRLPLSPVEATTQQQMDDGMGYREHMLDINLESLKKLLGTE